MRREGIAPGHEPGPPSAGGGARPRGLLPARGGGCAAPWPRSRRPESEAPEPAADRGGGREHPLRSEAARVAAELGLPFFVPPLAPHHGQRGHDRRRGIRGLREGAAPGWDLNAAGRPRRSVDTPSAGTTCEKPERSKELQPRVGGRLLDAEKRRALSDFYREEFLRYLDHFEAIGIVDENGRAVIARARKTVISRPRPRVLAGALPRPRREAPAELRHPEPTHPGRSSRPALSPRREAEARQRAAAAAILRAGLRAADPRLAVEPSWPSGHGLVLAGERLAVAGRVVCLAVGKAALPMAAEAAAILGDRLAGGLVVTNDDASRAAGLHGSLEVRVAGHPVPDARGSARGPRGRAHPGRPGRTRPPPPAALGRRLRAAARAGPRPGPGRQGPDHLAAAAGGSHHPRAEHRAQAPLAPQGRRPRPRAAPARVRALVLSDVVGDDLSTIASGPASPDPTTFADALDILRRRGLLGRIPAGVRRTCERTADGRDPQAGRPALSPRARARGGRQRASLKAAAQEARRQGYRPLVLTSRLEGEAREAARVLVSILRECVATGQPAAPPVCLLAGGETTVTVRGEGHGGRNQEMAVAAVRARGLPGPRPLREPRHRRHRRAERRGGRGGGPADAAPGGALGLAPPAAFLAENDSRSFLGPVGGLIVTGPTGTNVMDLVVLLADRGRPRDAGDLAGAPRPPLRGRIIEASPWRVLPASAQEGREAVACTTMTLPTAQRTPSRASCGRRTRVRASPGVPTRGRRLPAAGPARRGPAGRGPERLSGPQDRERGLQGAHHQEPRASARPAPRAAAPEVHRHPRQPRPRPRRHRAGLHRHPDDRGPHPGAHPAPDRAEGGGARAHPRPGPSLRPGGRRGGGDPAGSGSRAPPHGGEGAAAGLPVERARGPRGPRVVGEHQPDAGASAEDERLVGADEVPAEARKSSSPPPRRPKRSHRSSHLLPAPPAEEVAVRGFDDALDELLRRPGRAEDRFRRRRAPGHPPPARRRPRPLLSTTVEIDLLEELEATTSSRIIPRPPGRRGTIRAERQRAGAIGLADWPCAECVDASLNRPDDEGPSSSSPWDVCSTGAAQDERY